MFFEPFVEIRFSLGNAANSVQQDFQHHIVSIYAWASYLGLGRCEEDPTRNAFFEEVFLLQQQHRKRRVLVYPC
jgi:hypothetical protein